MIKDIQYPDVHSGKTYYGYITVDLKGALKRGSDMLLYRVEAFFTDTNISVYAMTTDDKSQILNLVEDAEAALIRALKARAEEERTKDEVLTQLLAKGYRNDVLEISENNVNFENEQPEERFLD